MPRVAMAAEEEDRDMGRAPCVTRNPTAYEQAGQKHGRTIPLADLVSPTRDPYTLVDLGAVPILNALPKPPHLRAPHRNLAATCPRLERQSRKTSAGTEAVRGR